MYLGRTYRDSLSLLTDLYELTMAYGYWKTGTGDQRASFSLFFREHPFRGGYTISAGLEGLIEWITRLRFTDEDISYLATLSGSDGRPLFDAGFLEELRGFEFACDVDAMPEGTVVFPRQPLVRVSGPIIQAQILETAALNVINFQSLIATKSARVCEAARGDPVVEFGLRRAHGIDGGLSASRAAYIGGCVGTSNVLAGKVFGIPVRGTVAHSWVMSFTNEREAFRAWADAMPNNSVFLVDTYDTLDGVRHAIEAGGELRKRGYDLAGIRLDSGDLAYLSLEARRLLDAGGFPDAAIMASNNLDEHLIASLKEQGAAISAWGVGTQLATAFDEPALGGVYKLTAVRDRSDQSWSPRLKLSEQVSKASVPGLLQIRRFSQDGEFLADMIYDEQLGAGEARVIVDPVDPTRRKKLPPDARWDDQLVPVFRKGVQVFELPTLETIRERVRAQLAALHPSIRRLVNPHEYPAGLAGNLAELRSRMIGELKEASP
jgi:nicotinate phosphoribosyltransferase